MPPKRKPTSTTENVASSTDQVPINKRGRKPKAETDTHGINNEEEHVSSPPKRSRPTRAKKVISYDETNIDEIEKPTKAKKEPKTKKPKKSGSPGPSIPDEEKRKKRENNKTDNKNKVKTEKTKKVKPKKKGELIGEEDPQNEDADTEKVANGSPSIPNEEKKTDNKNKVKNEKTKKVKPKKKGELIGEENPQNEDAEMEKVANGRPLHAPLENNEPPVEKVLQNKTDTDWDTINFNCDTKNGYGVRHNLIISTWNVGGIKSWVKKGCMEYIKNERPDIFCLQETKCAEEKLPEELNQLKDYHQYWCSSEKEGYGGVGLLTVKQPKKVTYGINDEEQDADGRCITAEYDEFTLVNVYVPNAGRKLITLPKRLQWNNLFKDYIKTLDKNKPVIICGDMNVSHNEIDLARPKNNTKNAGFTQEERNGMTDLLKEGFMDVYRHFYPEEKDIYSFWTYMANARAKNVGWRLDYFIISERIIKGVCDTAYRTQVLGSDHCPMTLFINI